MHFLHRNPSSVIIWTFLLLTTTVNAIFDPFTLAGFTIAAVGGAAITGYQMFKDKVWECCKTPWLVKELHAGALRRSLEERVYGQHIAIDMITKSIHNHVTSKPSKPLVLSFHGGTGVGKNYITRVLAEAMFKKGMSSKYVHLIIATRHFPVAEHASQYRVMLQNWISGNLSECTRNLFIFDEVDKIPVGVLDGLSSFLDYHGTEVDGVDQRAAVFIFLSNVGADKVDLITYEAWEAGKTRESLTFSDYELPLQKNAYNEESSTGLFHSQMILRALIDSYVPFLPLERRHVEACVRDYLREHGFVLSEEVVMLVAEELDYFPRSPHTGLFSTTGCKRIREKVVGHSAALTKVKKDDEVSKKNNEVSDPFSS